MASDVMQIMNDLARLRDSYQHMREDGDSDMRTVIYLLDRTISKIMATL